MSFRFLCKALGMACTNAPKGISGPENALPRVGGSRVIVVNSEVVYSRNTNVARMGTKRAANPPVAEQMHVPRTTLQYRSFVAAQECSCGAGGGQLGNPAGTVSV